MATISFENLAEALVKNEKYSPILKSLSRALIRAQNELQFNRKSEPENLARIEYALRAFNYLELSQLNHPLAIQHIAQAAREHQSHVLNHLGAVAAAIGKEYQTTDLQRATMYFELAKNLGYSESSYSPAGMWQTTKTKKPNLVEEVTQEFLKLFKP